MNMVIERMNRGANLFEVTNMQTSIILCGALDDV
jgi:hypothetical protein